jgi:hypothetical protein
MPVRPGYVPPKPSTSPKPSAPSWWQQVKSKLQQMTQIAQQGTVVPKGYVPPTGKPPAWYTPQMSNYAHAPVTNPYNRTPTRTVAPLPTGSFFAGGGQYVNTSVGPMSTTIPTGSFVASGGRVVRGPNSQAYNRNQTVNGSFLGAQGQAVRGPDYAVADVQQPKTSGGGGGSGGYGYKKRRRGGGGGGGGYGEANQTGYAQRDNTPAWAQGLANWSIG